MQKIVRRCACVGVKNEKGLEKQLSYCAKEEPARPTLTEIYTMQKRPNAGSRDGVL
jgi:hypothetical protein